MAAEVIKAKLMGILNEMTEVSKLFVKKPGESFIRERKLSLAADGSDIKAQCNPKDHDAYIQIYQDAHGYNFLHLNAFV